MLWIVRSANATETTVPDTTDTANTTNASLAAPAPSNLTAEKIMTDNLMVLGLLFFIFYFILIRPQQKKLKTHQAMIKSLAKGSKVITSGGLIGTIIKFEGDDIALIEVAQGIKVRIVKAAISEIMNDAVTAGESANDN